MPRAVWCGALSLTELLRASLRPRQTMHIGVLTLHLSIETAESLKDKRQVVKSLCAKLRNRFNVSVAEVDELDIWRRATVAVVIVSNEQKFANQVLSQVVNHVEDDFRAVLDDYGMEFL